MRLIISTQNTISFLFDHLHALEGDRSPLSAPDRHLQVREYLEETLRLLGAVRRQFFAWNSLVGVNLILELPGSDRTASPIIIGAHYDTVPGSPGADDNASGVAVLLELARVLSSAPSRHPVWLVAFDLEEFGTIGSQVLARSIKENGPKPLWMASLEMVGYRSSARGTQRYPVPFRWFYRDRGDFLLLLGNLSAHRLMGPMARSLETASIMTQRFTMPFRGRLVPPSRFSDHAPFWDIGVSSIMITDTAWLRNPHYHAGSDTMETLDLSFMAGIVSGLAAFIKDIK